MQRILRHARRGVYIDSPVPSDRILPIHDACIPHKALFLLLPNKFGVPVPRVRRGDPVEEGALLGSGPQGTVPVHSSIPGTVVDIRPVSLSDGQSGTAIEVELGGAFSFRNGPFDEEVWKTRSVEILLDTISDTGLVLANRQDIALVTVLNRHIERESRRLLINVLETVPHARSGSALLAAKPREIAIAVAMIQKILGLDNVTIACPPWLEKHLGAFFRELDRHARGVVLAILEHKYPADRPEVLLPSVYRLGLHESVDPLEAGVCILDPATLVHVYEAVIEGRPPLERVITLSGSAFVQPLTALRVRIGTPLYQVMEDGGGLQVIPEHLVIDDVMGGHVTRDVDLPIHKGNSTLVALTGADTSRVAESDCISCGECVRHCPMGLDPARLHKLLRRDQREEALAWGLQDCTGCGLCSHVCPSRIPLTQTFRIEKTIGSQEAKA